MSRKDSKNISATPFIDALSPGFVAFFWDTSKILLYLQSFSHGEMLEWLKRHAWKACVPQKGIASSNLALSAQCNALTIAALLVRQFLLLRQPKRELAFVLTDAAANRVGSRPASQCIARGDARRARPPAELISRASPPHAADAAIGPPRFPSLPGAAPVDTPHSFSPR